MSFDPMVANDGRLRILAALASQGKQEFVHLRQATRLTDGNLASHARRLKTAGMIRIDKTLRDGKPVTRLDLTHQGRSALESHAKQLLAAVAPAFSPSPGTPGEGGGEGFEPSGQETQDSLASETDDWVD